MGPAGTVTPACAAVMPGVWAGWKELPYGPQSIKAPTVAWKKRKTSVVGHKKTPNDPGQARYLSGDTDSLVTSPCRVCWPSPCWCANSGVSSGRLMCVHSSHVGSDAVAEPAGWCFSWKRWWVDCKCAWGNGSYQRDWPWIWLILAQPSKLQQWWILERLEKIEGVYFMKAILPKAFWCQKLGQMHLLCGTSQLTPSIPGTHLAVLSRYLPQHFSNTCRPYVLDLCDSAAGNLKLGKHFWIFLLFHVNFCSVKVMYWAKIGLVVL